MERTIRQLLFTVYNSVAVLDIQSCDFTFTSQGPFIRHWIPHLFTFHKLLMNVAAAWWLGVV